MSIWLASAGLALLHVLPAGVLLYALIGFIASFALSTGRDLARHQRSVRDRLACAWQRRRREVARGPERRDRTVFTTVAAYSAGEPLLFFAAMMAVQFMVVLNYFPGTKSVPLEG